MAQKSNAVGNETLALRINCGAQEDWEDADGRVWLGDRFFVGGGSEISRPGVAGPSLPVDFTARWSHRRIEFQVPLPVGRYTIRLRVLDTVFGHPGGSTYRVIGNGQPLLTVHTDTSLPRAVVVLSAELFAASGVLRLAFVPEKDLVIVSAIEILRAE